MKKNRRAVLKKGFLAATALTLPWPLRAETNRLNFVVPGQPGSGWDQTARVIADTMLAAGVIAKSSQINIADAGGRRAIAAFVYAANDYRDALLVHSTPLHLRAARGLLDFGAAELLPIAGLFEDPAVLVTRPGTGLESLAGILTLLADSRATLRMAGGSPVGGMDHLVALAVFKTAGAKIHGVLYRGGGGGQQALAALKAGDVDLVSTGLGEVATALKSGAVVLSGIAERARLPALPALPTFAEQGADIAFRNWRCVYGAPGLTQETRARLFEQAAALSAAEAWKTAQQALFWQPKFAAGADFLDARQDHWRTLGGLLRLIEFR